MDRDDDGETSYKYNTFVDDVAFEPTYLQALPIAAGRNVATILLLLLMPFKRYKFECAASASCRLLVACLCHVFSRFRKHRQQ